VPSKTVAQFITADHSAWLAKSGKGGKPHKDNPVRVFVDKESKYLHKWELLRLDSLKAASSPYHQSLALREFSRRDFCCLVGGKSIAILHLAFPPHPNPGNPRTFGCQALPFTPESVDDRLASE
jgi:hypothetical protein